MSYSPVTSHLTQFHGDNNITFPTEPGYGGTWSASGADLTFTYTSPLGATLATFAGRGVDGGCFEGRVTFPNSNYVSPYHVCLP